MTDLIDKYQPDFLYTDGHLPFEEYGLKMVAHLYNVSAQLHGGTTEAVYTSKQATDCAIGTCLLDHERGVSDGIAANPWQTDTCIGQWHYKRGQKYKTAKKVIDLLTDIVSKNGNLLLNFPLPNSGELDFEERSRCSTASPHGCRSTATPSTPPAPGRFTARAHPPRQDRQRWLQRGQAERPHRRRRSLRHQERFALCLRHGLPKEAVVSSLGLASDQAPGNIRAVSILGHDGRLDWKQTDDALRVSIPSANFNSIGITLKVDFA